ncbi:hypothetical protein IRJ41_006208 [Triplophysa rosa]|uniref:Integrase core domain-containing protein n=1 Tax=Triplophysa rosa TaxID=992332 RepID=A0A9W7WNB5_TRIRA|nr:hypothetical protein IRJ41_006208 [Triplophysa rosa]
MGQTAGNIAKFFGVCERTIRYRMSQNGLRVNDLFSALEDAELDALVEDTLRCNPNAGYKMMFGYLSAQGVCVQRIRVQESMRRVDLQGVLMRSLQLNPRRRRKYSVPGPNSLWHIDGNHKLIR